MNSQKIDRWFNSTKSNINNQLSGVFERNICYLIWNSNSDYTLEWVNNLPKKFNCIKEVNLRNYNQKITFVGQLNYKIHTEYINLNEDITQYFCRNKSFLKSHFQKCIRRGLVYKALLTGYLWWEENLSDFLRRLPIIMIEDVALFQELDIIVWFMVMIDQINIPETFKSWLGSVIISMAKYPTKIFNGTKIESVDYSRLGLLNINHQNFIYSLMIRRSYGGMKGDMKMINFTISDYINRFKNGYRIPNIRHKKYVIYKTLEPADYEISGLDFHCFPKILELIQNKFPQFSLNTIKKAIWENSSKINFREIYSTNTVEVIECWKIIQKDVILIQKLYIKKYIVKK